MLKEDCFLTYGHVKYYFWYEILIIFDSESLKYNISFLTAINLMIFKVNVRPSKIQSYEVLWMFYFGRICTYKPDEFFSILLKTL